MLFLNLSNIKFLSYVGTWPYTAGFFSFLATYKINGIESQKTIVWSPLLSWIFIKYISALIFLGFAQYKIYLTSLLTWLNLNWSMKKSLIFTLIYMQYGLAKNPESTKSLQFPS